MQLKKFGLIGYPLGHSWSARYFADKFRRENINDCQYVNFLLEDLSLFPDLLKAETNLVGLNITIPYKEKIIAYLDALEGAAKETGAVNCISIQRESSNIYLTGHNTDAAGFAQCITGRLAGPGNSAVILGTGGASKAAAWVLKSMGFSVIFVSRNPIRVEEISYGDITKDILEDCAIIINATPLGMMPNTESFPPIPYHLLNNRHFLFDMVYNPTETLFLKKGAQMGCKTMNGLEMLYKQAEEAWRIWNSSSIEQG